MKKRGVPAHVQKAVFVHPLDISSDIPSSFTIASLYFTLEFDSAEAAQLE